MANIYTPFSGDFEDTNQVCNVKLNGVKLPLDVIISLNGNKVIAQSQILDGVAVFERVTRKPFDVDFEFTVRDVKQQKRAGGVLPTINTWIFPLDVVSNITAYLWQKDEVLQVENLLLNKLGIHQLIVSDVQITTIRGKVDVPIRLKCIEDFYSTKTQGMTLLI